MQDRTVRDARADALTPQQRANTGKYAETWRRSPPDRCFHLGDGQRQFGMFACRNKVASHTTGLNERANQCLFNFQLLRTYELRFASARRHASAVAGRVLAIVGLWASRVAWAQATRESGAACARCPRRSSGRCRSTSNASAGSASRARRTSPRAGRPPGCCSG